MVDLVISNEDFDDLFFEEHGVGDCPIAKEYEMLGEGIDAHVADPCERRFVKAIVKGQNQTEAYVLAFGSDNKRGVERTREAITMAAVRLMKRPRVAKAMFDVQERMHAAADEDMDTLLAELNEDRVLARALGQPSAAIAAVKAKASLLGLENAPNVTHEHTLKITDDQKTLIMDRARKRMTQSKVVQIEDAEYVAE